VVARPRSKESQAREGRRGEEEVRLRHCNETVQDGEEGRRTEGRPESSGEINEKYQDTRKRKEAREESAA